jgi:hypothetical protein
MTTKLADHLRALPDPALGALLQLRPDLAVPIPADLSALAARAQGRVSVAHALDSLDTFTLEILDGLRLIRGEDATASVEELLTLAAAAGADPGAVRAAVDHLRARFLVYGPEHALHLVRVIDELTPEYPTGLGRPAAMLGPDVAEVVGDPAKLRRTLLKAPPDARAALDRLAEGPPIGTVTSALLRGAVDGASDGTGGADGTGGTGGNGGPEGRESPVRWLVSNGLLAVLADDRVELPREVGIVLRREAGPLGRLHPYPPEVSAVPRPVTLVDSAGAGQALDAVRHVDALLGVLSEAPAPVLKAGGLGGRELRRLAKETGLSEADTALLLEVAYSAMLLAQTEVTGSATDERYLPTREYDSWRTAPLAQRWSLLARTWYGMTRAASLIGQRDEKDRPVNALSLEAGNGRVPSLRRAALRALAELPAGTGPDADELLALLAWYAPRRAGRRGIAAAPQELTRAVLAEAATLGVTGLGALTGYARELLAEETRDPDADPLGLLLTGAEPPDGLAAALAPLLPVPVDHVLVQADLTVVVPGPPEPTLAAELAMIADAESRGGATVYRVTPASVRRALDAGYATADIHGLFQRRSRTPLPQTLTYLIDDVARRHGGLRVGSAGAYLRSDDEALITEVFADRRMVPLTLRRLAPTVLATPYPTGRLLTALREAGYAPVQEDASGAAVLTRPKAARAPARPLPRVARVEEIELHRLRGPRLAGVVEQIRLGDRLARAARRSPLSRVQLGPDGEPISPTQAHTQAISVLQQAVRDRAMVWVGYVDAHGGSASKLVRPVSMAAGYLRAEDDRSETMHTFALHRITSAIVDE